MLGSVRAYAQFEIDPDHYDNGSTEASSQPKTNAAGKAAKIHYEGNFVLLYSLRCKRSNLLPGKYSMLVESEGQSVWVTLNRGGRRVRLQGTTQRQNRNLRRNVLMVERNGAIHQLSGIQLPDFTFIFGPDSGVDRGGLGKPGSFQEVPLILADSHK
jgi:hypothetical protein